MKRFIYVLAVLVFTAPCFSQVHIGVTTGVVVPNLEESGLFKTASGTTVSLAYKTAFNLMVGVGFTHISDMKMYDDWPELQYSYEEVEYNTISLDYNPIWSLFLQYHLPGFNESSAWYFGVNGGMFTSEINGEAKYNSTGYTEIFNLSREEQTDFGVGPVAGFRYLISGKLNADINIGYDIILSDYKQHLVSARLGLVYAF